MLSQKILNSKYLKMYFIELAFHLRLLPRELSLLNPCKY